MVPQEHPEEHFDDPESEEDLEGPENYGTLAENNLDDMREQQNANELQISRTFAANNLHEQDGSPDGLEDMLVNLRIEHIKIANNS